jgi:hypothetical protein
MLPDSCEDAQRLQAEGKLRFASCMDCRQSLAAATAATTPAGWRETQISGMCEPCFDNLFAEPYSGATGE